MTCPDINPTSPMSQGSTTTSTTWSPPCPRIWSITTLLSRSQTLEGKEGQLCRSLAKNCSIELKFYWPEIKLSKTSGPRTKHAAQRLKSKLKSSGEAFKIKFMLTLETGHTGIGIRCFRSLDLSLIAEESKQSVTIF